MCQRTNTFWSLQHHISGDSVIEERTYFDFSDSHLVIHLSHKITGYIVLQNLWLAQSPTSFWGNTMEHSHLSTFTTKLYFRRIPFLSAEPLIVVSVGRFQVSCNFVRIHTAWIYTLPSNSCKMKVHRDYVMSSWQWLESRVWKWIQIYII